MKTIEYLAAVKAKRGITSDYALAKELGVSKNAVRNWTSGVCGFNEETCRKVADILEMHPGFVILDMQREHAKDDQARGIWEVIYKGFRMLLPPANLGKGLSPA